MSLKKAVNFVLAPLGTIIGGKVGKLITAAALVVTGVITGNFGMIAAGIGYGASAFAKKPPAHAQERLNASYDVHAPRKTVLGDTAGGTDVRYQAYTGDDQEYLEQIVCVASHECELVYEIWFDSKKAWSASGGITSDFDGYLDIEVRNPGTRDNGIAIDATWTADSTLTGCAYFWAKYKLTGNSKKAESPFASGVPSRMTVRVKGAKVPDLRVDGVDINDQTTWVYSDSGSDSGRNPAWARLFVHVGWRINGKLAVGQGIPPARLNLPSFTTAANHSDETVALDGGGSEPRYRHDMVYSEGEDRSSVLGNINDAMNAVATDDGGKIAIICLTDDLDDPDVLELSDDDLADPAEESWIPEADLQSTINVVRGVYTDPSDTSLYQPAPEIEVALDDAEHDFGSPDGIQRVLPFQAPQIQSSTQWQRCATLKLNRAQTPGVYKANFKARGWLARMYKAVSFTHRGQGFDGKLFRVIGIGMPIGAIVPLTLREVTHDEFGWDPATQEQTPGTTAGPTPWDPANDPVVGGIDDAGGTANWSQVDDDDGHRPTDDADVTAANVAAGFVGQKSGATTELVRATGAPGSPSVGDYWLDINFTPPRWKSWSGSAWVSATPTQGTDIGVDNGATAGATWGTNVASRPTELTDGRVSAGLTSAGDLARDLTTSRANTSNLLRYSAGGLFTGELAADVTGSHVSSGFTGQKSGATTQITRSASAPSSPTTGDYWLDTNFTPPRWKSWSGSAWVSATPIQGTDIGVDNGATAGATWGTNVASRPTELTDGRVSAGLNSSGDLARDLTTSRANTSNLLRYSAGGLFTGELAADVTATHNASSITGQSPWATTSISIAQVTTPGGNLIYDSAPTLGCQGWTLSGFVLVPSDGTGAYVYSASASVYCYPGRVVVAAGVQYAASLEYQSTRVGSSFAIYWYNSSDVLITTTASTVFTTGGSGRVSIVGTAPALSAFARVIVTTSTGTGYTLVRKIKFEYAPGGYATAWSDEATYGALYQSGVTIDSLQPAESGANITATHTAAAISSQSAWATYSTVAPTTMANRTQNFDDTTGRAKTAYVLAANQLVGAKNINSCIPAGHDNGTTASINIPSHTRKVSTASGVSTVTYNSGSVTGLAFSTIYYVYCDDPTNAGGTVTYVATTDPADLVGNIGRVFVGQVITPADGAGNTGGTGGGSTGGGQVLP